MSRSIEGIVSNPKICSGKPCVRGTRIPVHIILDLLAAGESFKIIGTDTIKYFPISIECNLNPLDNCRWFMNYRRK